MSLYQLVIPADEVYLTVTELATLGLTQFIDLNSGRLSHELRYAKPLKLIDES
jgi:hypothetical protein